MAPPRAQTSAKEITEQLSHLIKSCGQMLDPAGQLVTEFLDKCDKLQAADVVAASSCKAEIYGLAGDVERVEYWAGNMERNGARLDARLVLAICYSNMGFVSKAAAIYPDLMSVQQGIVNKVIPLAFSTASFAALVGGFDQWTRAGGIVHDEDKRNLAKNASGSLDSLEVPESQLQLMMDEAGTLMRERRLLWLNTAPDVVSSKPGQSPFVAVNYRVDLSPAGAADMTWLLADRLAEKGLMPHGLTVSFIGQGADA